MDFGVNREKIVEFCRKALPFLQGPVLIVSAYFLMKGLLHTGINIGSPGIVYIGVIVFMAFRYGLEQALMASAAGIVMGLASPAQGRPFHYTAADNIRTGVWLVFFPFVAVLTGLLKRRIDAEAARRSEAGIGSRARELNRQLSESQEQARGLIAENSRLKGEAGRSADLAQEQRDLFDSVLTNAPVGFAIINFNFQYQRVNNVLAKMLGVSAGDLTGKKLGTLSPEIGSVLAENIQKVFNDKTAVVNQEISGRLVNDAEGRQRHWVVSFFPIFGAGENLLGAGMIVDEITEEKSAQTSMQYYATHDVLTGLPNRKMFEEYLSQALARSVERGGKTGVLLLDLDRFKNINDSLGHEAGDQIMREVAVRLQSGLREHDLVARWGGDEFVIVLPNLAGVFEATRVAEKILKVFGEAIRIGSQSLHVFTTIGIAIHPRDGVDALTLIKNADAALYRAKELGKNRFEFYNKELRADAPDQLSLEAELRAAFESGQLKLFYQPIIDLGTGEVVAAETLIRWQHPTLGLLRPRSFIPLAENIGLIVPIGRWVMNEACMQMQEWLESGLPRMQIAVNLSPKQFADENLVADVERALAQSRLDPKLFELEITESLAMENVDRTRNKIVTLSHMGVGLTIDDFGTGYSSLSYLRSFPVSKLKIDKSFVKHCITEEQDAKIIRAIAALAHSLNLEVVAEGVDTEAQMGLLESFGCNAAQGFFISKPMAPEEFARWLKTRTPKTPPSATDWEEAAVKEKSAAGRTKP